jgi:hypothetical protein
MVYKFQSRRAGHVFEHCLGKHAARPEAIKFKLRDYLDLDRIKPPLSFGHIRNREEAEWLNLGNDKAGNCVVAGACHETMHWTRAAGHRVAHFTDEGALKEYGNASGWNGRIGDPSDVGLDMEAYASRRRKFGITDVDGNVHTVKAYAAIQGVDNLIKAAWTFGAVGLGIQFPKSAGEQFERQTPWTIVEKSPSMGGHYVSVVGRNIRGDIICVTWGRLQAMTPQFVERYMDEAVAYLSGDYLHPDRGLTPELLDQAALERDLASLSA